MQLREPYQDINRTLEMLMAQVYESMPYAMDNCPEVSSPEALYNRMKRLTVYKHDPSGVEFIQSMPTLFKHYTHRSGTHYPPGYGDCDCFTVSAIACLKANGFDDIAIVLRGRNKQTPVHIYPAVWDGSKWVAFDLTNRYYGQERKYPYRQTLPI